MAASTTGLAGALLLIALAACGGGTSQGSQAAQGIRACEALDLQGATQVLGTGTEHPGGDTEPLTCVYSNAGVAMLTIQLNPAAAYDQMTILEPHTPVQIGDRARYNVQSTGVVAVQLATGAHSATLSVQPIGTSQTSFLDPLLVAAREVASRLQ